MEGALVSYYCNIDGSVNTNDSTLRAASARQLSARSGRTKRSEGIEKVRDQASARADACATGAAATGTATNRNDDTRNRGTTRASRTAGPYAANRQLSISKQ